MSNKKLSFLLSFFFYHFVTLMIHNSNYSILHEHISEFLTQEIVKHGKREIRAEAIEDMLLKVYYFFHIFFYKYI